MRVFLVASAVVVAAACGSGGTASTATTGPPTGSPAGTATTAAADEPCPAESTLAVAGSDGLDGRLEVVTGFADVTLDENAELVFADYFIEPDPQFGLSAPVGDPEAPADGTFFLITITSAGEGPLVPGDYRALEPGEGAVSSPADLTDPEADVPDLDPHVGFTSMYRGPQRILPLGNHSVTLTEITDQHLCGAIEADSGANELQVDGSPTVTGPFAIERV